MTSTKKHGKKSCLKCGVSLSADNWATYDQKKKYYICEQCRKTSDEKFHQADPNYSKKQKNRYRMRRSAVILAYGNACIICGEDDYTKLKINGDINFLYNNIVQNGHQVICFNCSKRPYKNKYTLMYKKQLVQMYGGYCQECQEDRVERLTILDKQVLCYNCHHSKKAEKELEAEEMLKSSLASEC